MKILMVCLGNICRSPLAEGILKKKALQAGLNWTIDSAGTNGFHTGQAPHHLSQKVARQNNIDISQQISRNFNTEDFNYYDKIFAMAGDVITDMKRISGKDFNTNKATLFLNELQPGQNRDVPDPWFGDEDGYHEVFDLINKTCDAIVINYFASNKLTQSLK